MPVVALVMLKRHLPPVRYGVEEVVALGGVRLDDLKFRSRQGAGLVKYVVGY